MERKWRMEKGLRMKIAAERREMKRLSHGTVVVHDDTLFKVGQVVGDIQSQWD